MGFLNKITKKIKKGIGKGVVEVGKGLGKAFKETSKITGQIDRATERAIGVKASDIVKDFVPGGSQALEAYQKAKKSREVVEGLGKALQGKQSYKSVLREAVRDFAPQYEKPIMQGYEEGARETKRIMRNMPKDEGEMRDRGRQMMRSYYNIARDRGLAAVRPAVERDLTENINENLRRLKIRNPTLAAQVARLR